MSAFRNATETADGVCALSSFRFANLATMVAHQGIGMIKTARVLEKGRGTNCNFIDLAIIPAGSTIGLHTHAKTDEEIYVVVSGTGLMQVDEQYFQVSQGDVIVNKPGGTHGLINLGHKDLVLVVIDVPVSE